MTPDPSIPETTPDVAALALERDLYLANAKDLQGQLDVTRKDRDRLKRVIVQVFWLQSVAIAIAAVLVYMVTH